MTGDLDPWRHRPLAACWGLAALVACAGSSRERESAATTANAGAKPSSTEPATAPEPVMPEPVMPEPVVPEPATRGPEHAVFSLGDNRLLAHVQRGGGLVAVGGSASFAKYTRFGKPRPAWKLRREIDGRKVAIAKAIASLSVPLTRAQASGTTEITASVFSRRGTKAILKINGTDAGTHEIPAGWSRQTIAAGEGVLVAGENVLDIAFRGRPAAVEWMQIGGAVPDDAGVPVVFDGDALVLPKDGGFAYYVQIPTQGRVIGDVVGEGCAVDVVATTHDGAVSGTLTGRGGAVDLSAIAGKVARLDLTATGCAVAKLEGGALAIPGEAPHVERPSAPKYMVLWIMDTLRADKVKVFNPDARADVPNWERLAERGVVFRNAYVQGNESQASHASIWTSVYPVNHKINISVPGGTWKLDAKLATLGVLMNKAGFYTTGVTANGFITISSRYGSGFKKFSNPMRDGHGKRTNGKIPANMLWSRALNSLKGRTDDPFFLFLGTIDTHKPWVAREPWISKYHPDRYKGKFRKTVWGGDVGVKAGRMISTEKQKPSDMAWLLALYDCGVSYQDEYLGKLLDKLDEWGIAGETMIVVTADHGEELWERGRVGHGASIRETLVHIPLLISYPPLMPVGVVEEGVDTIDIVPTYLDAIGLDIPETMQGQSLIPLSQGVGRGYPRPAISTQYGYHYVLSMGGWKILVRKKRNESERIRVYDLTGDPGERQDVSRERPIETRFLTDALGTWMPFRARWRKTDWGVASNMTARAAADLDGGR